jgi:hypothetical protein
MAEKIIIDFEVRGIDNAGKKVGETVEEVKSLKQQFREAVKEAQTLAAADVIDQKKLDEAIAKTADLKDRMNDVNEQIAVMTAGSPFEKMANGLGDVGSKLLSLDFEGARESATRLVGISKELTFKAGIKGVKDLAGTFFQLGKALLTNPIFLIAAVITAIVVAIVALLKKLGILKPILDFIGKAFEFVGKVIDTVVQALKDFADWLGITNNAAEDAAQRQADAAEKTAAAYEDKSARVVQGIDQEIRMNELSGKSTEGLERKKVYWIMKTSEARAKADRLALQSARMKGELDEEEIKALEDKYKASQLAYQQSINDVKYFEASVKKEKDDARKKEKEAQESADKDASKAAADARKKRAAEQKQYRADRLAADRMLTDLELENMQAGVEKEIAINKEKYRRLIEDTKNNEKLLKAEKEAIIKQYEAQQTANEERIREEEKKKQEEKAAEDAQNLKAFNEQLTELKIQNIKNENERMRAELENEFALQRQAIIDNEKLTGEQKQLLLDELNAKQKEARAKLEEEITKKEEEEAEKRRKANFDEINAKIDIAKNYAGAVNSLTEGIFAVSNRFGKQDEKSKEERAKRQFKIQKAVNLGMAIIDGFKAITSSLAQSPIAIGPIPNPAGIASLAFAAVTTAANIAKIASAKYEGGNSGGGGAPSVGGGAGGGNIPQPSFSPTALFSTGGNSTQVISNSPSTAANQAPIKAYVVEQEMTSAQQRASNIRQQATI